MNKPDKRFVIKKKDNIINYNMFREKNLEKRNKNRPFTKDIFNRGGNQKKNIFNEGPIKINNLVDHIPKRSPDINIININKNFENKRNLKIKLNVNNLNNGIKNNKNRRNNTGNPQKIKINPSPDVPNFYNNLLKQKEKAPGKIYLYNFQNPLKKEEEEKSNIIKFSQSLKKNSFNKKNNKITFYNLLEENAKSKKKNLPHIENNILQVNDINEKIHYNPHHFIEEKNNFLPLEIQNQEKRKKKFLTPNEKLRLFDNVNNNLANKKIRLSDEPKLHVNNNNYINNIYLGNLVNEKEKNRKVIVSNNARLRVLPKSGNKKFRLEIINNNYMNNKNNIKIIRDNEYNLKDKFHIKENNKYDKNNYNNINNNIERIKNMNINQNIINNMQLIKVHKVPKNNDKNINQKESPRENDKIIVEISCKEDINETKNTMEDFTLVKSPFITILGHELSLFCVFDGHGGQKVAQYLKENFGSYLEKCIKENLSINSPFTQILNKTFEELDNQILKNEYSESIGSTAVVAVVDRQKQKLYCANVGDSRCYLIDNKRSVLFTKIHDSKNKEEVERVIKAGGMFFRGRFYGSLALTRAFGDKQFKDSGLIATPDISKTDLKKNNIKYIVLASDGVWNIVKEDLLFKMYQKLEKNSADEFCEKIINYSKQNGSLDNISCIVIKLKF